MRGLGEGGEEGGGGGEGGGGRGRGRRGWGMGEGGGKCTLIGIILLSTGGTALLLSLSCVHGWVGVMGYLRWDYGMKCLWVGNVCDKCRMME